MKQASSNPPSDLLAGASVTAPGASASGQKRRKEREIPREASGVAAPVAAEPLGDASAPASEPARGEPSEPSRKRRPGAPKGNMNGALYLASSKAKARAQRDRDKRGAAADLRAIVRERGVEHRADVRLVVKLLAMLLPTLYRYLRAAEKAPSASADGSPRGEHARLVEQASRVVGMLRDLFDLCAANAPAKPDAGSVERVVTFSDGRPVVEEPVSAAPLADGEAIAAPDEGLVAPDASESHGPSYPSEDGSPAAPERQRSHPARCGCLMCRGRRTAAADLLRW